MLDLLDLPVPASLREMGVTEAAVFLISFSDDQHTIEVEIALNSEHQLPPRQIKDVYALALEVYKKPVATLCKRLMKLSRLESTLVNVNAGLYCSKDGE